MGDVVFRLGTVADIEPAVAVWRVANLARRGGEPVPVTHEERVRGNVGKPDAFLLVADDAGEIVGMALGMQGLANDGAGPPIPGLCQIAMVFIAPARWDQGLGGRIVDAVLAEARSRGYRHVQLWAHLSNDRAHRLYTGHGFHRSGREMSDNLGETIVQYERPL